MRSIHPTAVIYPNVDIEHDVQIGPYCIIGAKGEKINTWNNKPKGVIIKSGTIITGHVTIDSGTERKTIIGNNNFIMKGVHIGHDVITMDNVVMACHALIGGFVEVENNVNIALGAIIHQRIKIPRYCMIGMGTIVTKKTEMVPGHIYIGSPAKMLKPNDHLLKKLNLNLWDI